MSPEGFFSQKSCAPSLFQSATTAVTRVSSELVLAIVGPAMKPVPVER